VARSHKVRAVRADAQPAGRPVAWASSFVRGRDLSDNAGVSTHPATNPGTITVYGAAWCGDCRRAKRLLDARGADYVYVDVATTPGVGDQLAANGYLAIPVVVMPDGAILVEPTDRALADALDARDERYSASSSSSSSA
jgi:mycoredoxin